MKQNKMIKLARILEKLFSLLFWISVVGVVLVCIFGLIVLFQPPAVQTALTLGPVSLNFQNDLFASTSHTELCFSILFMFLMLSLFLACVWTLKELLRPISMGQPFDKRTGKLIRRLAWLELAGGLISLVDSLVIQPWIFRTYELDQLLLNDKIQSVSLNLDGDFNFLLYFAVLFLLSWVFDYGKDLQRLSDETL